MNEPTNGNRKIKNFTANMLIRMQLPLVILIMNFSYDLDFLKFHELLNGHPYITFSSNPG